MKTSSPFLPFPGTDIRHDFRAQAAQDGYQFVTREELLRFKTVGTRWGVDDFRHCADLTVRKAVVPMGEYPGFSCPFIGSHPERVRLRVLWRQFEGNFGRCNIGQGFLGPLSAEFAHSLQMVL